MKIRGIDETADLDRSISDAGSLLVLGKRKPLVPVYRAYFRGLFGSSQCDYELPPVVQAVQADIYSGKWLVVVLVVLCSGPSVLYAVRSYPVPVAFTLPHIDFHWVGTRLLPC